MPKTYAEFVMRDLMAYIEREKMARKQVHQIEFDEPATIAEMIEALEDLRASAGPDAVLRFRGVVEFNPNGPRVKAIFADRGV